MQSTPWITLLKKIPAEQYNQLMLVTTSGIEIAIQVILVLDGECLVFKGRLSGSQDAGRLFYVPFDRIDYVGFNRVVTEDEFKRWYGDTPTTAANGTDTSANGSTAANGLVPRTPLPNRAALLQRIRSRPSTSGCNTFRHGSLTPPPGPLPASGRGSREAVSPSPLRGGGWGEGLEKRLSVLLDVVTPERVVLAQVEPAGDDDGVRPTRALWFRNREGADFSILLR